MRSARRVVSLCCSLLLAGVANQALAQIAPRLTGEAVIARLNTAKQDVATRASNTHDDRLAAVSTQLGEMADALRKTLGDKASQPADIMDDSRRAAVLRGDAAVQRTRAYLDAAPSCPGSDAKALTDALATTIDKLGKTSSSSKATPVINSVETIDNRPVFALHPGTTPVALALVGTNLSDPQCVDPQITATDEKGKLLDAQPVITGVLPTRIELKFPDGAGSKPGALVLHVVPKHKAFLMGCSAQPEATTALQVTASMRVSVSYNLTTTCGSGQSIPSSGSLPDITAYGATSSRQVDVAACPDPSRYAISAKVTFGDGNSASVGPVEQTAAADITMGLPAGFTLSWSPSTRTVFVRSAANVCKGVY
ncbi:hypothetical protein [Dyella nitratireducens]|uniref:Uncharacterized protein n=1 Tax=Dyella nitratireducens TaxID=1849580 RepID=A0ABQ1G877_9GAMM|nr:hypothetical protein [Dyella nitratireducens]GGA38633.1 hypothetical protein GCM10010981_29850 [Dyella nitratireducens]GLQ40342.1 hypothetical protein GCM10007902_01910 [Dyella nitratireducens]